MPIPKKWSRYTPENVKRLCTKRGVYELANGGKRIIYIGGSDA
jgi:hypothetical protein